MSFNSIYAFYRTKFYHNDIIMSIGYLNKIHKSEYQVTKSIKNIKIGEIRVLVELIKSEKDKEYIKDIWKKFYDDLGLDSKRNIEYHEIYVDKKRVGYMLIRVAAGVSYLKDLMIEKSERGKGYGKSALSFFLELSENYGCHKALVKTCPELMPAAYRLYKNFGFQDEAFLKDDYYNKDWVFLEKRLMKNEKQDVK